MSKLNVGVVLGILLFTGMAWSSPILLNVTNASFESSQLVLGGPGVTTFPQGLVAYSIPGWTISGTGRAGTYQPNASTPFTANMGAAATNLATGAAGVTPNNGLTQLAFLSGAAGPAGIMFQDLVALNSFGSFTLTVDVGHRSDVVDAPFSIILMSSGGTPLASIDTTLSAAGIGSGLWRELTLTYTGVTPVNDKLRVEFSASAGQVGFDNVSVLNDVPEIGGSAVFWTMFGVAGLFIYGKKRLAA